MKRGADDQPRTERPLGRHDRDGDGSAGHARAPRRADRSVDTHHLLGLAAAVGFMVTAFFLIRRDLSRARSAMAALESTRAELESRVAVRRGVPARRPTTPCNSVKRDWPGSSIRRRTASSRSAAITASAASTTRRKTRIFATRYARQSSRSHHSGALSRRPP